MASPFFLFGAFFHQNPASVFFTTPNEWSQHEGLWPGYGSEAAYPVVSLRLESDHTATVVSFPQGRSVQRSYKGEFDDEPSMVCCVDAHDTERYTGPATWERIDDEWIGVSFAGSYIRIAPHYGRFSFTPDWTELRFSTCGDRDFDSWRLSMQCGPSRWAKTHPRKPPTCEPRDPPRPTESAGS